MIPNTFGPALTRRLAPHTGLHPKQLAAAIGVDVQTIYNHAAGRVAPSYPAISEYLAFFADLGDDAFIAEVFPGVTPLIARKKEADEALVFVRGLAKFTQGAAA